MQAEYLARSVSQFIAKNNIQQGEGGVEKKIREILRPSVLPACLGMETEIYTVLIPISSPPLPSVRLSVS